MTEKPIHVVIYWRLSDLVLIALSVSVGAVGGGILAEVLRDITGS